MMALDMPALDQKAPFHILPACLQCIISLMYFLLIIKRSSDSPTSKRDTRFSQPSFLLDCLSSPQYLDALLLPLTPDICGKRSDSLLLFTPLPATHNHVCSPVPSQPSGCW